MGPLDTLDTPCVLVDLDVADANIVRHQAYLTAHGIAARPHIKTHKTVDLARAQMAAGAVGITCQKLGEAEVMADAGFTDILLTYNIVGAPKLARLMALHARIAIAVVADSAAVVDGLAAASRDPARPLTVLVECDTGARRCGVADPGLALALAHRIQAAPGLAFGGLMTYPPNGGTAAVEAFMAEAKALLDAAGLLCPRVTSGGSPDMWRAHEAPVVSEYRAGTYIYNDRSLVERGVCDWADCALTVLATVVSVPAQDRAVIDAGSKVLTTDPMGLTGHGHVLGRPDLAIDRLSEEHGCVQASDGAVRLSVGQRLRIVPNHVCVVSNMVDRVVALRDGAPVGELAIAARGRVT
ncbi:MAG: D-TA family PLP-dependent enzyme [Rhodospirillaceae bacterium]|nr:D-TA family PLP-dependent enzyme [Rhodospirillaceae bacterium]